MHRTNEMIVVWYLLFAAVGCDSALLGAGPHARSPRYAIGFANRTDQDLHKVHGEWKVQGEVYRPSAGFLIAGATARINEAPDPIPASADVIWTTSDGKEHRQTVEAGKKIPNAMWGGTLWFKITAEGVEVVPLTEKQEDDRAANGQRIP